MGSKFFIIYLRQKWCQINDLYVAVALYWVCRYSVQLWTSDGHNLTFFVLNFMPHALLHRSRKSKFLYGLLHTALFTMHILEERCSASQKYCLLRLNLTCLWQAGLKPMTIALTQSLTKFFQTLTLILNPNLTTTLSNFCYYCCCIYIFLRRQHGMFCSVKR